MMALTESQKKQAEKNRKYWENRESEALKHYITDEKEYKKQLDQIYQDMLDGVQNEIYSFYGKYATKEGITIAEAKKRVAEADIKAYERKAKQYVKDAAKDRRANFGKTDTEAYYFSDEANAEMRLYNLTMKVNRLEMLKANIGLELIDGHSKLEKFMSEILQGRTEAELKRQAGILGKTIQNNAQAARVIVNASFHNATFSQRIWMYNEMMKADLSKMLQTGLIQGKNARVLAKEMEKYFIGEENLKNGKKGAKYHAETLMITELARVQIDAQKESFLRNGFTQYTFHANSGCCSICSAINGKHFDIKDMMPAKNAPPMHPRCRCSVSAYEDSADYEAWLDFLSEGGTTEEWNAMKAKGFEKGYAPGKTVGSILRTYEDPIREKLGSAFESHPEETKIIIEELESKGVELEYRENVMGYMPNPSSGKSGKFVIDKEASYSAWLHERQHVLDDEQSGWKGFRNFMDPEVAAKMEDKAYEVEIDFARSLGYNKIVKRLEELKANRHKEVLGE